MTLSKQVMVVTGGSSGIGLAAAEAWAGEGATVVLLARGRERLQAEAGRLRRAGAEVHDLVADVSSADDCARVAAFLEELAGRVDLLFNNAGVMHPLGPLHELAVDEFDRVIRINLRGVWLLTRSLVPLLTCRPGAQVLNTTSGLKQQSPYGAYSVSKSAVDALSRVMADELAPLGVRVNTFNPGWVRTAMAPDAPHEVATVVPRLLDLARATEGPTGTEIHA